MTSGKYESHYYRSSLTMSVVLRNKLPTDMDLKIKSLDPNPGEEILDVGCGLGLVANEVSKHGATVTGVDVSEYAVKYCRKKYPNIKFELVDALKMDYSSEFDKIMLDQVLEHFDYAGRRTVLENVHRALKASGSLVVGVPINDFTHHVIIRKLAALLGIRIDDSHRVNFSFDLLERELRDAGFSIVADYPMFQLSFIRPLKLPYMVYHKWFGKRVLLGGTLVRARRLDEARHQAKPRLVGACDQERNL